MVRVVVSGIVTSLALCVFACSGGAVGGVTPDAGAGADAGTASDAAANDGPGKWGQDIAAELFEPPDPNFDKSKLVGLYQVVTIGVSDELSPIRVRIDNDFIAFAHKTTRDEVIGVRVPIQISGDSIVFLDGALAVNETCVNKRIGIEARAEAGKLTYGLAFAKGDRSGNLPIRTSQGTCSDTELALGPDYGTSISLTKIGK